MITEFDGKLMTNIKHIWTFVALDNNILKILQ